MLCREEEGHFHPVPRGHRVPRSRPPEHQHKTTAEPENKTKLMFFFFFFSNSDWKNQHSTHDKTHPSLKPIHYNLFFFSKLLSENQNKQRHGFMNYGQKTVAEPVVSRNSGPITLTKNNVFSHSGLLWPPVTYFVRSVSWHSRVFRLSQQSHFGIWTDSVPDRRHGRRTLKLTESQEISEDEKARINCNLQEAVRATCA